MARELTAEERDELTPGELEALMGAGADDQAATTTAATTEATTTEAKADDEAATEAGAETTTAEGATETTAEATEGAEASADELQAVVDEGEAAPAQRTVTYKGITDEAYKAETAAIAAAKAEGLRKLMDGEIDASEYAAIEAEQAEKRDSLIAGYTLAKANREAAEQQAAAQFEVLQTSVKALMKQSKGQAVDYNTDLKAQRQFDAAMNLVASDPDNARISPADCVAEAHRMVMALRGVSQAPAAAPTPAPANAKAEAAAQARRELPRTLGGVPAAAPNGVGNDVRSQFALLSGEDAEEFLARQPANVRQALLHGANV